MKRLGIFLFFDDEGFVDPYVEYLLKDIICNFERLVIVCNGILSEQGQKILEKYSQEIMVRPNIGFDAGGFKDVIVNYLGWNVLEEYDEIILFNDSFFGPLYPFKIVFDKMDTCLELDYWGLSSHGAAPNVFGYCPYETRPRYLQTYFLAFRKKLIASEVFQDYWNNLEEFKSFEEAAEKFGCHFTKLFEDAGFKWGVYSDTSDLESEDIKKNLSNHTFNLYEMIKNRKFPIIKRKTFVTDKSITLRYNYGNDLKKAVDYIEKNTNYDTRLIYRYLLRKYNLDDIKKCLNLVAIVSDVDSYRGEKLYAAKKAAVIVHTFYPDLFEYELSFLQNIPKEIDIIITNSESSKLEFLKEKFGEVLHNQLIFLKVEARGRDLSALLVGCHDYLMRYDYICFLHDKKSAQKEYATVGASFNDLLWENMLFSAEYISNILNRFEENPCLGLLVPPNVYHGTYFHAAINYWTICYDKTVEISRSLGIDIPFDRNKDPFSVGSVFWCRTDALKTLFQEKFEYTDFPGEPLPGDGSISHALERIFPFVAQHNGYYSEYLLNPQYAESELMNFRTMHSETIKALVGMPGINFATHYTVLVTLKAAVERFRKMSARPQNIRLTSSMSAANYQRYQLRYSFLVYVEKHAPQNFSNLLKRLFKIPYDAFVYDDIGFKGALSLWADEKAPSFLGKILHGIFRV